MNKQKLRQYRAILQELRQLEMELKALRIGSVGAVVISDMPRSTNGEHNPVATQVENILKLQGLIEYKMSCLIKLRMEIETLIDHLEPAECVLIRKRYVEGKRWERIAVEMNYDYSTVLRRHKRILAKI